MESTKKAIVTTPWFGTPTVSERDLSMLMAFMSPEGGRISVLFNGVERDVAFLDEVVPGGDAARGPRGYQGNQGDRGYNGVRGYQGYYGNQGRQGPSAGGGGETHQQNTDLGTNSLTFRIGMDNVAASGTQMSLKFSQVGNQGILYDGTSNQTYIPGPIDIDHLLYTRSFYNPLIGYEFQCVGCGTSEPECTLDIDGIVNVRGNHVIFNDNYDDGLHAKSGNGTFNFGPMNNPDEITRGISSCISFRGLEQAGRILNYRQILNVYHSGRVGVNTTYYDQAHAALEVRGASLVRGNVAIEQASTVGWDSNVTGVVGTTGAELYSYRVVPYMRRTYLDENAEEQAVDVELVGSQRYVIIDGPAQLDSENYIRLGFGTIGASYYKVYREYTSSVNHSIGMIEDYYVPFSPFFSDVGQVGDGTNSSQFPEVIPAELVAGICGDLGSAPVVTGRLAIGHQAPLAPLHVRSDHDEESNTLSILDVEDVSTKAYFDFRYDNVNYGSHPITLSVDSTRETGLQAPCSYDGWVIEGMIRVRIDGQSRFIPYYSHSGDWYDPTV